MIEKRLTREIAELYRLLKMPTNNYVSFTVDSFRQLGIDNPHLQMKEFTRLDPAAAETLIDVNWLLCLDGLTSLTDQTAYFLRKHKKGGVSLNGLTSLSDKVAEYLGKYAGSSLGLNGLTSLSDKAAESLGNYEGELHLNGLTSLSDEAAESLCKCVGSSLELNGLTSLSDKAAESLGNYEGKLFLHGLTSLSDAAAESLSKYKGEQLSLDLDCLSESAAEILGWLASEQQEACFGSGGLHAGAGGGDWGGSRRRLMAEKRLTKEIVKQFLAGDRSVKLSEFTELDYAAAEILRTLTERVHFTDAAFVSAEFLRRPWYALDLSGLTELTDVVAESLSKQRGILRLNGLTRLSDESAKSLSKHDGDLFLNALTDLSDVAAESLRNHEGRLHLNGLRNLSNTAAEHLSRYQGSLSLDGLTTLSDIAAESFSQHKGEESKRTGSLSFNGLTSLSDAAAESLSKHEGRINLDGLKSPAAFLVDRDRETCLSSGFGHYVNGRMDWAIECFDQAIRLDPEFAIAHLLRGYAHNAEELASAGPSAIEDYTEAIRLNPKLAAAFVERGGCFLVAGDNEFAMSDISEAIRLYQECDGFFQEKDDVSFCYLSLARLDKDSVSFCYLRRAYLHQENDDFDSAITDYTEAIRLSPECGWAYRLRATCYGQMPDTYGERSDDDDAVANTLNCPPWNEIHRHLRGMG